MLHEFLLCEMYMLDQTFCEYFCNFIKGLDKENVNNAPNYKVEYAQLIIVGHLNCL